MQRYIDLRKQSKRKGCSFYQAINRQILKNVLLKKIPQKQSWNDFLRNKNFIYSSKQKMFLKTIEVFKNNDNFFIVTQRPNGPSLTQPQLMQKIQLNKFYLMFQTLITNILQLKKFKEQVIIYPQWIFVHHNSIKIGHFEPFYQQQDLNAPQQNQSLEQNLQRSKLKQNFNIVFTLGCVAYTLITGKPSITVEGHVYKYNQQQELIQKAQKTVLQESGDESLAKMVNNMLTKNEDLTPKLEILKQFFDKKQKDILKMQKSSIEVEFSMQKINLNFKNKDKNNNRQKTFFRECCKTVEDEKRKSISINYTGNFTNKGKERQDNISIQRYRRKSLLPFTQKNHNQLNITNYRSRQIVISTIRIKKAKK